MSNKSFAKGQRRRAQGLGRDSILTLKTMSGLGPALQERSLARTAGAQVERAARTRKSGEIAKAIEAIDSRYDGKVFTLNRVDDVKACVNAIVHETSSWGQPHVEEVANHFEDVVRDYRKVASREAELLALKTPEAVLETYTQRLDGYDVPNVPKGIGAFQLAATQLLVRSGLLPVSALDFQTD